MRLITEKGQLALPSNFKFDINIAAPAFSKDGSQSLPVSLPDRVNDLYLDFPARPGRSAKQNRKITAKIEAGVYHKSGQLVIDTAKRKEGITGAIMINESDIYAQIKDITLPEVFEKIKRVDISGVENWYNHIYACMTGTAVDDFTAFPVAVNLQEDKYELLNKPDASSLLNPWALDWKSRRLVYGNEAVTVPDGYGVTPFLWMWRMLELLFTEFNYSVRANPFKSNDFLKKIVLINNTADSICTGSLNYADLVPSCSIADFIKWLEAKFLTHLYIYPESKIVDLVPLRDVINSVTQMDVSNIIDGNEKYSFTDLEEIDISSETTLQGSAPAVDTYIELGKKYKYLTELDENDWKSNAWKYTLVYRKSTGEYYEILRRFGDSSIKRVRIGSNYFRHFTGRLTAKEYKAKDLMPTMVQVNLGLSGSKEINVVCPYIGDYRHRNTSYKEKKEATEQNIIIAIFAGASDEDIFTEAKYCLGTTQKYNNLGVQWSTYDLTIRDLYPLFWKEWNKVLMNSGVNIEAKVDFSTAQLLSLRLDKPVLLNGQPCLVKSLSYTVGQSVVNSKSEYMLLRNLTPIMDDITVSFAAELYRWDYESNNEEVFGPFDTQEWENYTWEYTGESAPSKAAFEFIPSPTFEQYTAGGLYYQQRNEIRIAAKKINETQLFYFDEVLESGFRPILIE